MTDQKPEMHERDSSHKTETTETSVKLTKEQQKSLSSLVHGCKDAFFTFKEEQSKNSEQSLHQIPLRDQWKHVVTLFDDYTGCLTEADIHAGDESIGLVSLNEKLLQSNQAIESLQAASKNLRDRQQLHSFAKSEFPSVAELQGRVHDEIAAIDYQIYRNKRMVAIVLDAAQQKYQQALELRMRKKNLTKSAIALGTLSCLAFSLVNPATGKIDLLNSPLGQGVTETALQAANHELISPKAASTILELQRDPKPELLQYFLEKAVASTRPGQDVLRDYSPELATDTVLAQQGSLIWQEKQYVVGSSRSALPMFPEVHSFSLVSFDASNTDAQFYTGSDLQPGAEAITPEEAYTQYRQLHPDARFMTLPWGWTADGDYTPRHAILENERFSGNGTISDGKIVFPMSGINEPDTVIIKGKTYMNPANGSVVSENGSLRIESPEATKELFTKAADGQLDKSFDVSQPSWIMEKSMYEDGAYDTEDVYNWTIMIDGTTADGKHKTSIAQFDHLVKIPLRDKLKMVVDSVLAQYSDIVDYKIAIGPKGSTTTMSSSGIAKEGYSGSDLISQEDGRTSVNIPKAAHVDASHLVIELK